MYGILNPLYSTVAAWLVILIKEISHKMNTFLISQKENDLALESKNKNNIINKRK